MRSFSQDLSLKYLGLQAGPSEKKTLFIRLTNANPGRLIEIAGTFILIEQLWRQSLNEAMKRRAGELVFNEDPKKIAASEFSVRNELQRLFDSHESLTLLKSSHGGYGIPLKT